LSKYYAVNVGRETGIFNSWEDCKKQVEGYSGASYKSFSTLDEAKDYLNISTKSINEVNHKNDHKVIDVYVDGSYNDKKNMYSYGCVFLNENKTTLSGVGSDKRNLSLRNVAGELLGAITAIKWGYNNDYKLIKIHHDYEGISKWATGEWKANKEGTKEYVQFIKVMSKKIDIQFVKVKAHSGDKYNEKADLLAKEALENEVNKEESNPHEKLEEKEMKSIFYEIVHKDELKKNSAVFFIEGIEITESKLFKVAKSIWRYKGNKIKDIKNINVSIDANTYEITWLIVDKYDDKHLFSINLD